MHKRALPTESLHYKLLAATYTVLLGFVLPFICWGSLATPGHPHGMAHIVFLMPPTHVAEPEALPEVEHTELSSSARQPNLHQSGEHTKGEHDTTQAIDHSQHAMEKDAPLTKPVGRSVPDELTSAITILSPLFVVQILLVLSPVRSMLRLGHRNTAHLFDPRVLTPPPR